MKAEKEIKIVQREAKVLHEKTRVVPVAEITSAKIKKVISDMKTALDATFDGVAIAAPQIGSPLRIFVVSGKILPRKNGKIQPDVAYINPVIKKLSSKKVTVEEGCLSVRWLYGKMKRAETATIEAYNESGHKVVKTGKELLAQVFQHETDHLDGKLFIEKAFDVYEAEPEE